MIKCPKCLEENQLGAIFCRFCGEKLNLDELSPDSFNQSTEESKGKALLIIIRNLVLLLLIVAIIGAIASVFLKPEFTIPNQLNPEETKIAMKRFKKFRKGKSGNEYAFNNAEVDMLAKLILDMTEEKMQKAREDMITAGKTPVLVTEALYINLLSSGQIKFVLRSQLMDKVPIHSVIIGTPVGSPAGLSFTASQVFLGKLPIPIPQLQDLVIKNFVDIIRDNANFEKEVRAKAKEISVGSDQVSLKK